MRSEDRVTPLELFFDLVFVLAHHPVHGADGRQPDLGRAREGAARARRAVVGVGRLRLAHQRGRPRGGRRAASRCSPRWPRCSSSRCACREASATRRCCSRAPTASCAPPTSCCSRIASRDDPGLRRSVIGLAASTALGVGLLVAGVVRRRAAAGRAVGARARARHGRAVPVRLRGLEAGARPLRRAPRPDRASSPWASRSSPSAWAPRPASTPASSWPPCSASRSPPRCGGCTSTSSRSSPSAGSPTLPRAGSATRSRATPSPTCTSRWSPASCCWRSA